jgi:hypothetical protein
MINVLKDMITQLQLIKTTLVNIKIQWTGCFLTVKDTTDDYFLQIFNKNHIIKKLLLIFNAYLIVLDAL